MDTTISKTFPIKINEKEPWELSLIQLSESYAVCLKRGYVMGTITRSPSLVWRFKYSGNVKRKPFKQVSKSLKVLYARLVSVYDKGEQRQQDHSLPVHSFCVHPRFTGFSDSYNSDVPQAVNLGLYARDIPSASTGIR